MRTAGWIAVVLAAMCFAFGASRAGAQEPIKIGHYGSLTGSEATFGQSTSQGIRLAIKEFNDAGGLNGRKIELTEYDTKGDAREAGAVVTRLVSRDHATAVLGEVASGLSLAGAPVCQQAGVPMISPSSTNERVTKVGDMIFRVCFIDNFQGLVCAKFAHDVKKANRVAILQDQAAPYSVGLADEFEKHFKKMGGEITTRQSYNGGEQDFAARLTTIRATNPDIIFVPGYYTDVANIAIQARKLGITVPLLGGDGWDSAKLGEIAGKSIDGSFYANHYSHEDPSPTIQEFIRKYQDEYGAVPDGLAALGYDAANLLFDSMKRAKSLGGKDLAAAIAATKDFKGVTGNITIDPERNAVKSAVIVEMKNGSPHYVTTIAP
jgi:branched-chain amino acid transport system substrate-binding protein